MRQTGELVQGEETLGGKEDVYKRQKCGFRLVGRRERIARDCHGRWLDTFLMAYRAAANEPEGYKKL